MYWRGDARVAETMENFDEIEKELIKKYLFEELEGRKPRELTEEEKIMRIKRKITEEELKKPTKRILAEKKRIWKGRNGRRFAKDQIEDWIRLYDKKVYQDFQKKRAHEEKAYWY